MSAELSDAIDLPAPTDWFAITGKDGIIASYPKGLVEYPRRLLSGKRVRVGGALYDVQGVELFAVDEEHPANHWGSFGLWITPAISP